MLGIAIVPLLVLYASVLSSEGRRAEPGDQAAARRHTKDDAHHTHSTAGYRRWDSDRRLHLGGRRHSGGGGRYRPGGGGGGEVSVGELERELSRARSTDDIARVFQRHRLLPVAAAGRAKASRGSRMRKVKGENSGPAQLLDMRTVGRAAATTDAEQALVFQHLMAVREAGACGPPQPVVLNIESSRYSHPSKIIFPAQYILHRCGVLGGCMQQTQNCVPKEAETVELPFMESPVGGGGVVGRADRIRYLRFINHTACECKSHSYLTACRVGNPPPASDLTPARGGDPEDSITLHQLPGQDTQCLCPPPYVNTHTHLGCGCDCLESNDDCLNVKYGIDTLPPMSHGCVVEGICQRPECSTGTYDKSCRRCPMADAQLR